jgi:tetratricopeptide (TPR) repeat protein
MVRSVDGSGPGVGALLLIFLAAVLAVTAVVLRMRRHARPVSHLETLQEPAQAAARPDSNTAPKTTDLPEGSTGTTAALGTEAAGRGDLPPEAAEPAAETARTVAQAARSSAGSAEPGTGDKIAEAKALFDKARSAFDDGNFGRAHDLTDASLKLRKTARTYLLRAQASQRLGRIDDALGAVDAASRLAPEFASVWELRGRILWAAQRRDEARAAFEKFLALVPDDPKAASVRRLLNEPR